MRAEGIDKRVRGYVRDTIVVDTRRPQLFWEDRFLVPSYAIDPADVRTDLLRETEAPPPGPWSFHAPHGPVSQWFDLIVDGETLHHAAWRRDDPLIADQLVFSWDPALPVRWTEEEQTVASHPRDPHHRVEVLPSSRHVVIRRNGVLLADSSRPVLLYETDLPTRYYLPIEDVELPALTPSSTTSHCPYKGVADRYWNIAGQEGGADLVWSYSNPEPAVGPIAGHLAFYNEHVDLTVDGVELGRAISPFSEDQHRPN